VWAHIDCQIAAHDCCHLAVVAPHRNLLLNSSRTSGLTRGLMHLRRCAPQSMQSGKYRTKYRSEVDQATVRPSPPSQQLVKTGWTSLDVLPRSPSQERAQCSHACAHWPTSCGFAHRPTLAGAPASALGVAAARASRGCGALAHARPCSRRGAHSRQARQARVLVVRCSGQRRWRRPRRAPSLGGLVALACAQSGIPLLRHSELCGLQSRSCLHSSLAGIVGEQSTIIN
jgi:hypothetical protein